MKIVRVRFEDGHVEIIDEETLNVARAIKAAAEDPVIGAPVKVFLTHLMFHEAKRKAALKNHV